jgi:hypothetical protein
MKSEKIEKQRMKGDNLVLYILIILLIAIALLVGARQGYELGIKMCNNHYSGYIRNNCMCRIPMDVYKTERVIPVTMLNLSVYDS